jgi:prophage tail gpP-like protein
MSVELIVAGQVFGGWQQIAIERGIEQLAGTFTLSVTDRWNTQEQQKAFDLKPGQACKVQVHGQTVITGYIDDISRRYDEAAHEITLTGRDKAGDLVDCSAIYKTGVWNNKTLDAIARDVLAPFGIGVIVKTDLGGPIPVLAIQEGESVFELLERAARMKAVLLVSDGAGNVLLTRAGVARGAAELIEGGNILQAEGLFSDKDRFSDYIVKGQSSGNDHQYAGVVAHVSASVKDAASTRYRPLIIMGEDQGGHATLKQRAEWERNVRAGRATRATVTVQGWQANGQLWQPNTVVRLRSPLLAADLDVLIVSVGFSLDDQGTFTRLECAQPQAFDTIENVKQTRLEKKIRKAQGTESGITQPEWDWKP